MRAAIPTLCALVTGLIVTAEAFACSTNPPAPFEIGDDGGDDTPPPAPTVSVERVKRGKGTKQEGCSQQATSCDDIAYALLNVNAGNEDDVGFVVEVTGRAPEELKGLAAKPIAPDYEPGQLRLYWGDGEGEESYDFELEIWSVDRAGNMSETSTRVRIESDGSDGCSAHAGDAQSGWLAALCALLFVRRSRAARSAPKALPM